MKTNLLFVLALVFGGFFSLKKGFKERDKEGYFSINISFIGAGITMLVIAIIIIVREF